MEMAATRPRVVNFMGQLISYKFLAALGLLLSVYLYVVSLIGVTPTNSYLIWGLRVGIFVVWFPTIAIVSRMLRSARQKDWWKTALFGCPRWMRLALYALLGYAVASFLIAMHNIDHDQAIGGHPSSYIRAFSVHLAAFYGIAFAMLYSAVNNPATDS
jgi:hypothetical protein